MRIFASKLAQEGFCVFPLLVGGKAPAIKKWQKKATMNLASIKKMWARHPGGNIGVACGLSKLIVIDLDVKDDVTGIENFENWCEENEIIIPDTLTVKTPSGGRHLYFDAPDGSTIGNSQGKIAPGVDVRANGGYVVSPPSRVLTGEYDWVDPDATIAECPDKLYAHLLRISGRVASPTEDKTVFFTTPLTLHIQELLDRFCPERCDNREMWSEVGMALAQLGAPGLILWDAWSRGSDSYEPGACAEQFATFQGPGFYDGKSLKSLQYWADEDDPSSTRRSAQKQRANLEDCAAILSACFGSVRRDLCDDTIRIQEEIMDDTHRAIMLGRVNDWGAFNNVATSISHTEQSLLYLSDQHSFHPIKDYLNSLKWDGKDHIDELCSYFTSEKFASWFRYWLIGAVAHVLGRHQNPMMVLVGKTRLGKSEFAEWLCPLEERFSATPINPDDKDSRLRLAQVWIWEAGELGSTTRRRDVEALKHFLTVMHVTDRKPYGRHDIHKPTITSFIGTVNDKEFLVDRFGNRRYLTIHVDDIDWSYTELNKHQLWAQAVALYQKDDSWKLDSDDLEEQAAVNKESLADDPVELAINAMFKPAAASEGLWSSKILEILRPEVHANDMLITRTVSRVLQQDWGCIKKRRKDSVSGKKRPFYYNITERDLCDRDL